MRSATYISLTSLYDEVQARIVHEMMHGLFLIDDDSGATTTTSTTTSATTTKPCARARFQRVDAGSHVFVEPPTRVDA
jgi:hypothetical protein